MRRSCSDKARQPFLELVLGPMKAQKSTYIKGEVTMRSLFEKVILLSPMMDTRCTDSMQTHDGHTMECVKTKNLFDIEEREDFLDAQLVVIDEAQFFDDLLTFYRKYQLEKSFIVVGLDANSNQKKFGQVWDLIPYANTVVKHNGMCDLCRDGTEGIMTVSLVNKEGGVMIEVPGQQLYYTVCREHAFEINGERT